MSAVEITAEIEKWGARAAQTLEEADLMIDFLRDKNVQVYLEIGARHGWTFYLVAKTLKPRWMIAVDLPGKLPWGDTDSEKVLERVVQRIRADGIHTQIFYGDSIDPTLVAQLANTLCGEKVDMLFIDGDHKYAGVKSDWLNYSPFVRDGGYVIFHDVKPPHKIEPEKVIEVGKLWDELAPAHEHWLFHVKGGMGVGILKK